MTINLDKKLNKEVLRLALPSVLANITIPLVGMVDTAVAGHLSIGGGATAATYIGAVSVGSMFFSLLYWGFSFLRTGTSGLTAQAYGREDRIGARNILIREMSLAFLIAVFILAIQTPFIQLVTLLSDASTEVKILAKRYFDIRIWAAPATIMLMVYRGWFVGMQDSFSSMWVDLIVNVSNIVLSILLSRSIGFDGIALGTVCAQYMGLSFCVLTSIIKYKLGPIPIKEIRSFSSRKSVKAMLKLNNNLFLRSAFLTIIYYGYTMISAGFGDLYLSCGAIMMQVLMLFSYFTDGFAYSAEALTGRFLGAKDESMLKKSIKYSFCWSMLVTVLFIAFYAVAGVPIIRILTDDREVIEACRQFLPWLVMMPIFGCIAFFLDGVLIGATEAVALRNAMAGSALAFFGLWYLLKWALRPENQANLNILLACYFAHLIFRTIYLGIVYKPLLRKRLQQASLE